jgi:protein phosphatase
MHEMSQEPEDTVEFGEHDCFTETFFAPMTSPVRIDVGAKTDRGKVRSTNQDHFAVVKRVRSSELLSTSLPSEDLNLQEDTAHCLVVADGIGGNEFGEFASRLAVRSAFDLASQATSWIMKLTDLEAQQAYERVAAYVQRIQSTMKDHCQADPRLHRMGTTWTSAYLMPPRAMIVHIGDSRAYLFRDEQLTQLTRDETLAQAFIDSGADPDAVQKYSNVLLNSFGCDQEDITAQIHEVEFDVGDQLLLCSDGLTDMISVETIAAELRQHADPQAACDALVDRALESGGRDNVTVVLAVASQA